MTRIIKFRAWDTIDQTMYPVEQWANNSWVAVPIQTHEDRWELSQRKLEDVHLMQFTGLLDKNGKEIYEGDILRDENRNHSTVDDPILGEWVYIQHHECGIVGEMEIIGNIYENPELTEQD